MGRQLCVCVRKGDSKPFYLTIKRREPGWALVACLETLDQGDNFLFLPVASDEEAERLSAEDIRSDKRTIEAHVTRRAEPGNYHLRLSEGKTLHKVERFRSGARHEEELKINVSSAGPITTLDAVGGLDVRTAAQLVSKINQALRECDMVLLDVRGVNMVAGSAMAMLLEGLRESKNKSKTLKFLVDPHSHLVQAIAESHLDEQFGIYTTREEAVQDFLVP